MGLFYQLTLKHIIHILVNFQRVKILFHTAKVLSHFRENLLCLGITVLFSIVASAQIKSDYQYQHFTTDDGLPSSEVHCVIQDSKGYMWFGTDNGVSRFDGYEFKNFGYADGLGNPVVFEIFEDSLGNLSFATMDGKLWIYNGETIEPWKYNYKVDSLGFGKKSASVKAISEDGWVSIADQIMGLAHIGINPAAI